VEQAPEPGEEVTPDTPILLRFDQPMDRQSVADAFVVTPEACPPEACAAVEGDLEWRDETTVVFRPKSLALATRYRVSLAPEARSQAGVPLSNALAFAFSTLTPLAVTQMAPQDGAVDVRADAPVFVAFNRPLVPVNCAGETAKDDTPCPTLPLRFEPSVLGQGTWINSSLYRFDPLRGWGGGASHRVILDAGLTSVDGARLSEPVMWTFNTALPRVEEVSPADGQDHVLLQSGVHVVFNTPMDRERTASEFSVAAAGGGVVPGAITWEDNGATLTFTPTEHLRLDTRYIVQVGERARAVTSAPLENPLSWSFTTVPTPTLVSFAPAVGAEDVRVHEPVRVKFAGAIDAETVAERISVSPAPEEDDVYAYFDADAGIYHISWNKTPRTEYCVTVEPGIADIYGNTLDEGATACFTTGDLPPFVGPATSLDAVTLDAAHPAQLYYLVRNREDVVFNLYTLPEEAFVRAWDTTGTLFDTWEETFDLAPNVTAVEPVDVAQGRGELALGYYKLTWETPQWGGMDELYLAVIDTHVTLKLASEEALVWVTDLRSGVPLTRTAVRLVDREGLLIAAGTTDEDGVARIPISPREDLWDRVAAVVGEPGVSGFGVAVTQWHADAAPWAFGIPVDSLPPASYRAYLHTDRPIYRPGQTVNFRGVLWQEDDARYSLPPLDTAVSVSLRDPMWDEVFSSTLTLSELGTFDSAVALTEDAPVGEYTLQATLPDVAVQHPWALTFGVAAYRKPEFEVRVTPEQSDVLAGASVRVALESRYFFGGPVRDAQLTWTVRAEPYTFSPDIAGPWQWGPESRVGWQAPEIIAEGQVTTDAEGRALISLPAELASLGDVEAVGSQRWSVEATVVDESGFPVSGRGEVVVHRSRFYLGLQPRQRMVSERGRAEVEVLALDWESVPVAGQEVSVTLARRAWHAVPPAHAFAEPGWIYTDTAVSSALVTTDELGKATTAVKPSRSGAYVVIAEVLDAQGNPVRSEAPLWVSGPDAARWQMAQGRVTPVADAREYTVGETAQILVPTPFTGTYQVLMTVERGGVLQVERYVVDEANPVVELPIVADYIPNVYVSFVLIRNADAISPIPDVRVGYVELAVDPAPQTLDVTVTPDAALYEPGAPVTLTVRTADVDGQPVDAEVGISLVDKAVLTLRPSEQPSLEGVFYGPHPLRVVMGDGLLVLFNRRAQQLETLSQEADRMVAEATMGGVGGGGVGPAPASVQLREDFPDTALWDAHLRTGASGEAQVTLALPDALTTWVARVDAVTADAQVGEARAEFQVSKPLLVRPITPRFFVVGDRPQVSAVVHNNTGEALDVQVRLQTGQSASVEGDAGQIVYVPAGGRQRVAWTLVLSATSESAVSLVFSAEGGAYQDASRPTFGDATGIPLYRYLSPDVRGTSGVLAEAGSRLEVVRIPEEAGDASAVRVRVEPSLAAALLDSLSYLESYPYATTDALVSRILPNVMTYQALQVLDVPPDELAARLQVVVPDALDRLYARQNPDGGWGWWRDWSNMHLTSYAALGLIQAERAGFTVRSDALERALDYIAGTLTEGLRGEVRYPHYAFALYVLSEGDAQWPARAGADLYAARDELGVTGRAYLAMAFGLADASDTRIGTLIEELRGMAKTSATGVHWESVDGVYWQTDTLATSVVLDAMARFAPDDVMVPQVMRWLMVARRADHWETPYETAWAIIALTDAMLVTQELEADYAWGVALNGVSLVEAQAGEGALDDAAWTWRINVASGGDGVPIFRDRVNVLEFAREGGPGRLYYATHVELALPVAQLTAEDRGITVLRAYCALDSDVVAEGGAPACRSVTSVSPGDTLEVQLTLIVPQTRHYVLLEDPYPAGLEPVNPALSTTPQRAPDTAPDAASETGTVTRREGSVWWWDPFERRELRDERAVFFARALAPGTYRITYRLRAAVPGTYHALPATASEMYFPEVWGRTGGTTLEVLPVASP
jgi:hypothetical protein